MTDESQLPVITAEQVANYVVCPEAWRLKYLGKGKKLHTDRVAQGAQLRREWVRKQDLSATLRYYAKIVYLLVFSITVIVFLLEHRRTSGDPATKKPKQATESHEEAETP